MPSPRSDRRVALRLLLGASAFALSACGRKGAPLPPLDVDPCYPRHYPMDQGAKDLCAKKEEDAREHPPQTPPKRGQRQSTPATQTPAAQPATQPPAEPAAPAQPSEQPQTQPAPPEPPSNSQPQ